MVGDVSRRRSRAGRVALTVAAAVCWAPIWLMLVWASHESAASTTFPPPLLPGDRLVENARAALAAVEFGRSLVNSAVVSGCVAVGGAFLCALAGYAFAKLRFPGRGILFTVVLVGLALPVQLALIPNYLLMSELGWIDGLQALIVPGLASAFGVFWMRQHIAASLPDDVLDAAALDGCSPWATFRHVALPLVRPGATVLAAVLFVSSWSDFLWPFVVLRSPGSQTVQVALRGLQGEYGVDYGLVFAGALLATVPMLLLLGVIGLRATHGLAPSSRGRRVAERPARRAADRFRL
jgi:cellobiose transport system permease protein